MSSRPGIYDALRWCLLGVALISAACKEEGGGPERGMEERTGLESESAEWVTGEPPPILTDEEYAEAKRGASEGRYDSATMLTGHLNYVALTSGSELTESQLKDRALGYEVLAMHGICDSAAKALEDNSISRYISQERLKKIRRIHGMCDGRHNYVDIGSGENSNLPIAGTPLAEQMGPLP